MDEMFHFPTHSCKMQTNMKVHQTGSERAVLVLLRGPSASVLPRKLQSDSHEKKNHSLGGTLLKLQTIIYITMKLITRGGGLMAPTRKLVWGDGRVRQPKTDGSERSRKQQKLHRKRGRSFSPSRSAPSSMSAMRSFPADESSSNRESVFRSKARFSTPPLVGVLQEEQTRNAEAPETRRKLH